MTIKKCLLALGLSIATIVTTGSVFAQALTEGVVRRVDLDNNKVTIRHGEIKSLDMPPMTMVFTAKQPALLKTLAPGDEILFEAFEANGQFSVGKIQKK